MTASIRKAASIQLIQWIRGLINIKFELQQLGIAPLIMSTLMVTL